ncbi:MAG: TonB-dependent receptor [Treponema sp.]|nr:TonB-dependent receptor [Treponema sp.]
MFLRALRGHISSFFFLSFFAFAVTFPCFPDETEDEVYRLPETEVSADRDRPEQITRDEMDRDDKNDLWEAVRDVPGVILSGGGRRNDSGFTVRGYGSDSVPVYVDGIQLANPYRGEGDSARILTGDLESVEIEKGFSSELLGANNLGGAVLLRTAKPKNPLEASLKTGVDFDSIFHYADSTTVASVGTKLDLFYARAIFQYRDINHWRLPAAFEPVENNPQQKGDRLWSDSDDVKLTLFAGFTPIAPLDIWLSYVYQKADKGTSPPDTETREYVIWDWPVWNRHSISLNGKYQIDNLTLSGLFYFDKYDNRLDEYKNLVNYELGIHAPHSDYNEYSLGSRLLGSWEINSKNTLQAALTYKHEDHKGLRGEYFGENMHEETHISEDTWSVGAEYAITPWEPLTFKAGLGFDALIPLKYWNEENEFIKELLDSGTLDAGYFVGKTKNMFLYTWQAGIFYTLPVKNENQDHTIRLTYARKNHFPAMSQRYSTRFGSTLPNPNLGPEKANHLELGYAGYFCSLGKYISALNVNTALYYSFLTGKIVTIQLGDPSSYGNPNVLVDYSRNLDALDFYGFEASPELSIMEYVTIGLSFSWNQYHIRRTQDGIKSLSYYPAVTAGGRLVYKPVKWLTVIPRVEYVSSRYTDTLGDTKLDGYFLTHFKVSADIGKYFSVSAGIDNIFDTYYEIRQYSPMAGRSFNISAAVKY